MNWSQWKSGLFVAALTGLLTGLGAFTVADHIDLTKFGLFLLVATAKDALLWLKSHPIPEDKTHG